MQTDRRLVVRGAVQNIEMIPGGEHYVDIRVDLELTFTNTGSTPLIILKPGNGLPAQMYCQGGQALALTKVHAQRGEFIWNDQAWPSVDTSPVFRQISERLDQKEPPAEFTLTLNPQSPWKWRTLITIRFYTQTNSCCSAHDLGWEVISKIDAPLWLRLYFGTWPVNLERADPGIRKRLQRRWKSMGSLFASDVLVTEPIEVRLSEIKRT
ncbi:MAG: hypothetical protein ABSH28_17515 [Acidobacteriota bacterium]